jgi:hypothetical protein
MGWCSATYIFDTAIEAAYKLQHETMKNSYGTTVDFPNTELIEFAKTIRDELEDGDWDCQNESEYWEDLAKYLWPKHWQEYLEYKDD